MNVKLIDLKEYDFNSNLYKIYSIIKKIYHVNKLYLETDFRIIIWSIREQIDVNKIANAEIYLETYSYGKDIINCLLCKDNTHIDNNKDYVQEYYYGNNSLYTGQSLKLVGYFTEENDKKVFILSQLNLKLNYQYPLMVTCPYCYQEAEIRQESKDPNEVLYYCKNCDNGFTYNERVHDSE